MNSDLLNSLAKKVRSKNYKKDPDFLGQGSFGRVFKVGFTKPAVALKALNLKKKTTFHTETLERELTYWPDLSKEIPDAVPILHGCFYDNYYMYIMQEMLYSDLENVAFQDYFKKLPLMQRYPLLLSISQALTDLHGMKVVHNDFKLANMMFTDSTFSAVKLIDFGFATNEQEKFGSGTPIYSAPEKINNGDKLLASPAVDIWSLGICFLEMLSNFNQDIFLDDSCYEDRKFSKTCFKNLMKTFDEIISSMWPYRNPGKFIGEIQDVTNIFDLTKLMLSFEPENRPSAEEVVEVLEELQKPKKTQKSAGKKKTIAEKAGKVKEAALLKHAGQKMKAGFAKDEDAETMIAEDEEDVQMEDVSVERLKRGRKNLGAEGAKGFDILNSQIMADDAQEFANRRVHPMDLRNNKRKINI